MIPYWKIRKARKEAERRAELNRIARFMAANQKRMEELDAYLQAPCPCCAEPSEPQFTGTEG